MALEKAVAVVEEVKSRLIARMTGAHAPPSGQLDLEDAIAERVAPVKALPNPYILRSMTGEVQIFRIPAHPRRRRHPRRR